LTARTKVYRILTPTEASVIIESHAHDPFAQMKAAQREGWAFFAPLELLSTPAAFKLVRFAGVQPGQKALDVGCGTGVVAITAARLGAVATGLDLTPALLEKAWQNAETAGVAIEFHEGDVEALPFKDAAFDVVLSQFGHMFGPRPSIVVSEMLRVLRPGGRIAFSTWPPELFVGKMFALMSAYLPPPPAGAAPPVEWGNPDIVRERLGDAVTDLAFDRDILYTPGMSPEHVISLFERTVGPIIKLVESLKSEPARLKEFRSAFRAIIDGYYCENQLHQSYLMTRATKK
jgi:SAM-dependent methyltransferase